MGTNIEADLPTKLSLATTASPGLGAPTNRRSKLTEADQLSVRESALKTTEFA